MAAFIQDPLLITITLLATIFTIIILYFNYAFKYWKRKGVPYLTPKFPLGNSKYFIVKSSFHGIISRDFYNDLKKLGHKFGGIYTITRPALVLVDPDYIKDILVKDFQHFVDRGFYHNEKTDPISAHLFAVDETRWKNIRSKLSPTFTSGKMKMMFDSVVECAGYMKEEMDTFAKNNEDINIREILNCFTVDVIGSVAFGINCNSFKHPNAEFRVMGKRIFEFDFLRMLNVFVIQNLPGLAKSLGLRFTRKDVSKFFRDLVETSINYREKNNVYRPDFLQLLIDMKNSKTVGDHPMTMDQLSAQCFLFFVAGYDTSSSTMSFSLYELAKNQKVQEKLRQEINTVLEKYDGKITYDGLNEMVYLGQVLDEALRMYPPILTYSRKCTKDYKLRDTDITIDKGTTVIMSPMGLHRDSEYFPNPDQFDPDRFTAENKKNRHPFVHIPFGEGPRNCIGLRFGWMQSKIGIITIIKNYKLILSPKMNGINELTINPHVFLIKTNETIYLRAEKL